MYHYHEQAGPLFCLKLFLFEHFWYVCREAGLRTLKTYNACLSFISLKAKYWED